MTTSPHIFTAIFGSFDTLKQQPDQGFEWTFYNEHNAHYPMHTQDNRMKAKFYKMLAHRITDADIIGWVDGNVQMKHEGVVNAMLDAMGDADVVISKHPFRKNVIEECGFIVKEIEKGNRYLRERYEADAIRAEVCAMPFEWCLELYWCGLFMRRNNPKVNAAFEDWFMENVLWTNFDQNSFVKIIHKHGLKVATIDFGPFYDNEFYKIEKHLK